MKEFINSYTLYFYIKMVQTGSTGNASGENVIDGSTTWNISDGFTKINVLKILIEINLYEIIATFGKQDLDQEISYHEIP